MSNDIPGPAPIAALLILGGFSAGTYHVYITYGLITTLAGAPFIALGSVIGAVAVIFALALATLFVLGLALLPILPFLIAGNVLSEHL